MCRVLNALILVLVVARTAPAMAQTAWEINTDVDRLTDAETLTAIARSHSGDTSRYELTLRCSPSGRELTIGAFTKDGDARTIPWTTRLQQRIQRNNDFPTIVQDEDTRRDIRYRIDTHSPESGRLVPVYANVGRLTPVLTSDAGANLLAKLVGLDVFGQVGLPRTRIVIADVFPDESVEFSFETLNILERKKLEAMCGLTPKEVPLPVKDSWTDARTGERLPMDDSVVGSLRDNHKFVELMRTAARPPARDPFEKTEAFEARRRQHGETLSELLSEPVVVARGPDHCENRGFRYDPDREQMEVVLIDSQGACRGGVNLVPMDGRAPHLLFGFLHGSDEVGLLILAEPFIVVTPAPKRSLLDRLNRIPERGPTISFRDLVCRFSLSNSEARDRSGQLAVLFRVRASGVKHHSAFGVGNQFVGANYALVASDPSAVDVWVVDRKRKERLASVPLPQCIVGERVGVTVTEPSSAP